MYETVISSIKNMIYIIININSINWNKEIVGIEIIPVSSSRTILFVLVVSRDLTSEFTSACILKTWALEGFSKGYLDSWNTTYLEIYTFSEEGCKHLTLMSRAVANKNTMLCFWLKFIAYFGFDVLTEGKYKQPKTLM